MQRTQDKKRKEEEQRRYQATLQDKEKDDQEFRKRSDSERRRRLQVMPSFKNLSIKIDGSCNLVRCFVQIVSSCYFIRVKYMSLKKCGHINPGLTNHQYL